MDLLIQRMLGCLATKIRIDDYKLIYLVFVF